MSFVQRTRFAGAGVVGVLIDRAAVVGYSSCDSCATGTGRTFGLISTATECTVSAVGFVQRATGQGCIAADGSAAIACITLCPLRFPSRNRADGCRLLRRSWVLDSGTKPCFRMKSFRSSSPQSNAATLSFSPSRRNCRFSLFILSERTVYTS